jgi:hypothetical protein
VASCGPAAALTNLCIPWFTLRLSPYLVVGRWSLPCGHWAPITAPTAIRPHLIEYRGARQAIVEELAEYAGVPVFNRLTDEFHPT